MEGPKVLSEAETKRRQIEDKRLRQQSEESAERAAADPRVQSMLAEMDRQVQPGEGVAFLDLSALRASGLKSADSAEQAAAAEDVAEDADENPDKAHFDGVRLVKLPAPEGEQERDKVVVSERRTLQQVAAEAGIAPGEFKKLKTGDQRMKTQVAMRILRHIDAGYPDGQRTVGGGTGRLPRPAEVDGAGSKNKKWVLAGLLAVLVGGAFLLFRATQRPAEAQEPARAGSATAATAVSASIQAIAPVASVALAASASASAPAAASSQLPAPSQSVPPQPPVQPQVPPAASTAPNKPTPPDPKPKLSPPPKASNKPFNYGELP